MKLFIALLLVTSTTLFASTEKEELEIQQEGQVVTIVNFEEGSKIKVFETATGIHILSKKRGQVDLSQLPEGSYTIIDTYGRTIQIVNDGEEVVESTPTNTIEVVEDAPEVIENNVENTFENEEYANHSGDRFASLEVAREGNTITVTNFEDGDEIKVFEFQGKIHVLTKKSDSVDLTQLPEGKYLFENNKNQIAIVEKMEK